MSLPAQPPGLLRRIGSLCYELLLVAALLLAASALVTPIMAHVGHTLLSDGLLKLYFAAALFAYFGLCWVRTGQTVAMKAWRLTLCGVDGARLNWAQALRRFLIASLLYGVVPLLAYQQLHHRLASHADAAFLSLLWWWLPLGWAWFDPARQFLHDRLSGTRQWHQPRPPHPDKVKSPGGKTPPRQ